MVIHPNNRMGSNTDNKPLHDLITIPNNPRNHNRTNHH